MHVYIHDSVDSAAYAAADRLLARLPTVGRRRLGVATGSSPEPLYNELAERVRGGLDLSDVEAWALDEYVGLAPSHPESYASVVARHVTDPLGLDARRVHTLDGFTSTEAELQRNALSFEESIRDAGGIDVQILGIGRNGHIGFNEPGSSFGSRTRIKRLSARTRADNARFFADPSEVPEYCLTQGIGTILEARNIVLLAFGEAKAAAIAQLVEGPVRAQLPASILQMHEHVDVFLDPAAASLLTESRVLAN